jgi:hypothetical protein
VQAESTLFSPEELEELVGPIALYPDDLVGIVLPASTYPLDVVQAARFLDEYENDRTSQPDEDWDDSIVALLNYPDVLRLMNEDLEWTWDLGEAFLTQQADVLDAVQRFREQAQSAGNLASNERQVVREDEGVIEIAPADPKVIYVPYYEPRRVIVHHHEPVYYYPRPYPVYYYPYPANYSFHTGFFWGVTSAFVVGWNSHFLHVHHHAHRAHPYYSHYSRGYYDPFYVRRAVNINIVNVNRSGYVWRPNYRAGVRPNRVAVTRYEGQSRRRYDSRSYETRSYETRSYEGARNARNSAGPATRRSAGSAQRLPRRAADQRAITNGSRSTAQTDRAAPQRSTESVRRSGVPRPSAGSRSTQRSTEPRTERRTERDTTLSPYAARNPRVADSVRRQRASSANGRESAAESRSPNIASTTSSSTASRSTASRSPAARTPAARTPARTSASTIRAPRIAAPARMAPAARAPSIRVPSRAPAARSVAPSRSPAVRSSAPSRAPAARSAAPSRAPAARSAGPSSRSTGNSRSAPRAFSGGQRR